jgi:hypothetical protein
LYPWHLQCLALHINVQGCTLPQLLERQAIAVGRH